MLDWLRHECARCREAARSIGRRKETLFMLDHRGGASELYQCRRCGEFWEGSNNSFGSIAAADAHACYWRATGAREEEGREGVPLRDGIDPASGAIIGILYLGILPTQVIDIAQASVATIF